MTLNLKNNYLSILIGSLLVLLWPISVLAQQPSPIPGPGCTNIAPSGQPMQCLGTCDNFPGTVCRAVAYPSIGLTCDCVPTPTPTPTPQQYEVVTPCENTEIVKGWICTEFDANCLLRHIPTGVLYKGRCIDNRFDNRLRHCACTPLGTTQDGCRYWTGPGTTGACYLLGQGCTYQGSGPDDPDNGKKGVCVTRQEINIDTLQQELKCVCNEAAVCGDDRIDVEQGEVCDPPGRPTDGCPEGASCSEDCKRCIPPEQPPPIF